MDKQDQTNEYSSYDLTQDKERTHRGIDRPPRPGLGSDRTASMDEAKAEIKEKVSRGIGIVAGAVEGFVETLRDSHLAELTKEGIELVGDTVNNVVATTKEQFGKTMEAIQGDADAGAKMPDNDIGYGGDKALTGSSYEGPNNTF